MSNTVLDEYRWSYHLFTEWGRNYPQKYGEWQPAPDPFTEESPSEETVIKTLNRLSPIAFVSPQQITVIPDSNLFGFPFSLSRNEYGYLGQSNKVSTVPSISWLLSNRSSELESSFTKNAWIGSPSSKDWTIHYLRDRLFSPLQKHNFNFIGTDLPVGLKNSGLAIIGSHGGLSFGDTFYAITDSVQTYSAKEFAAYLRGSGCIVLFVCHSGRSDTQIGNTETIGVVSELLKVNVKCVIAPPWPLHVAVAEAWLPKFLDCFVAGENVGQAVYSAALSVRQKFNHPCAWLAMQLYGDASFCLK